VTIWKGISGPVTEINHITSKMNTQVRSKDTLKMYWHAAQWYEDYGSVYLGK